MDATHVAAFGTLLTSLTRIFHRQLEADDKAAYLLALSDLSYEAVQHACIQALREETFMPVPAILRAYAKEWQAQQRVVTQAVSDEERLLLREALVDPEEVRRLIASVWPGQTEPLYEPQRNN